MCQSPALPPMVRTRVTRMREWDSQVAVKSKKGAIRPSQHNDVWTWLCLQSSKISYEKLQTGMIAFQASIYASISHNILRWFSKQISSIDVLQSASTCSILWRQISDWEWTPEVIIYRDWLVLTSERGGGATAWNRFMFNLGTLLQAYDPPSMHWHSTTPVPTFNPTWTSSPCDLHIEKPYMGLISH